VSPATTVGLLLAVAILLFVKLWATFPLRVDALAGYGVVSVCAAGLIVLARWVSSGGFWNALFGLVSGEG
jgi:hypothetical protein